MPTFVLCGISPSCWHFAGPPVQEESGLCVSDTLAPSSSRFSETKSPVTGGFTRQKEITRAGQCGCSPQRLLAQDLRTVTLSAAELLFGDWKEQSSPALNFEQKLDSRK